MNKNKNVLTTREFGKLCGVDLTSIINWTKRGEIKAYKTAGGHRRIKKDDAIEFMKKYSIPFPLEFGIDEGVRALIVDDSPDILKLVEAALRKHKIKFVTETAVDAFDAGNKLAKFNPDIMIIDIRLPGIDGYQVIEKTRRANSKIKILAMTAYRDEKKAKAINSGADGYILKPFLIEDFLNAVSLLL